MNNETLNIVIIGINTLVIAVFYTISYFQNRIERRYNANVRWFKDFFDIKKDIDVFYKELKKLYEDCTALPNCPRDKIARIDQHKSQMINSTIKYLQIFNNDIFNKCSVHLENISDELMQQLIKKDANYKSNESITKSEIDLYKKIFDYDIKKLFR